MNYKFAPIAIPAAAMMAAMLNAPALSAATTRSVILDTISLGDAASESAHGFDSSSVASKIEVGGLGQSARILLPRAPETWDGGSLSFTLKVDPIEQNYITVRLWGGEANPDMLMLLCDGKQIGYRHLGDVPAFDASAEHPRYPGRFFYQTLPLPLTLTQGRTSLPFEIRASGPIWGYGNTWDRYQKPMTEPTRGIYRVYSHTSSVFTPPASEKQGTPPAKTAAQRSGPEVLDQVKARVSKTVKDLLASSKSLNQMQIVFLAHAYHIAWTPAYHNPAVVTQAAKGLDALYTAYKRDPKLMQEDPSTPNPGWFGFGPAGDAVWFLSDPFQPLLSESIDNGNGGQIARRSAWAEMLRASIDWNIRHRRQYTNQSMIVDLNVTLANRGLAKLDAAQALPQDQVLHYLYQSVGLEPWLGSETGHGPSHELGDSYYQLTAQGLTRELGYVGYYGEVLDWVTQIYEATRPALDKPGDEKIHQQLIKIIRARSVFRAPAIDEDGSQVMRIETVVGWRDTHFPGDITYAERPTWDASTIYAAAAALDSHSIGYVQQMFAAGQFFPSVADQIAQNDSLRVTTGLLPIPDQYDLLKSQPPSQERLPMTPGRPNFAWADPEDGVVAVKHGDEVFYASLYWRARTSINNLAQIHDTLPNYDRIATVHVDEEFEPSGLTYPLPDWTNFGFGGGGLRYPDGVHSAYSGLTQPIAKIPAGVPFKVGSESPYAGKASFYKLQYGHFLIGVNASKDKTFDLAAPAGVKSAPDLISGKAIALNGPVKVKPGATVVLYLGG